MFIPACTPCSTTNEKLLYITHNGRRNCYIRSWKQSQELREGPVGGSKLRWWVKAKSSGAKPEVGCKVQWPHARPCIRVQGTAVGCEAQWSSGKPSSCVKSQVAGWKNRCCLCLAGTKILMPLTLHVFWCFYGVDVFSRNRPQ